MEEDILKLIINDGAWYRYVKPIVWDGQFERVADKIKHHKISLCTTCMDRMKDLNCTYLKNIMDNFDYDNFEFLLLDYNSKVDDLEAWIRDKSLLMEMMENGTFTFYRTSEPEHYSMSHSRNIAFRVAAGDIVLNVDADNFIRTGFITHINELANEAPGNAFFGKGKKMLRGRLGFYREDFINNLGGYSEELEGYGHEDHDIMHRAWGLGRKLMWFGGKYYANTGSPKHQITNYSSRDKNWRYTEKKNKIISFLNIALGRYKANEGVHWGKATLMKNFSEEVII